MFPSHDMRGWEVHYRPETKWVWNPKTGKLEKKIVMKFTWPFSYGDKLPKGEKSKTKKEVIFEHYKRKSLAKISANREDYDDLYERIGYLPDNEFKAIMDCGMKGFILRNYIQEKYLTYQQAHRLFWQM